MLRQAVGIVEESYTYIAPYCSNTRIPGKRKYVRYWHAGMDGLPKRSKKFFDGYTPDKITFHETEYPFTLPIQGVKSIRAEKLSGDGKFKSLKIQNETASVIFVANGPN